ncbi:segregation and condensation protein A [Alienimonas chondri]|uniref:Segregation and condensation protein A n=1 Tax=Alienimonas chondri TaxID=2681879 RepID=A0ABX1V9E5_9PLAN|nr:segregation/condensation protein A [Alienimonas chondri]NNJ24140.1 Segregation and condensation protein A [Alienimonas chondri]
MTADAPALAVHRPQTEANRDAIAEEEAEGFRIGLDLYVGPVDLLHHLARRSEVDLLDLPLAKVVGQFEAYSKALGYLDLDGTGDFLSAATHLVEMKSKRALPVAPKKEKEEAPSEDRTALLSRLLEYRRYKEAAAALEKRASGASERLPRIVDRPAADRGGADRIRDVELWDLVGALARVIEPAEEVGAGTLKREEIPVAKWVERLDARIRAEGRVRFEDCFEDPRDRGAVTGAFLAVLELLRHHRFRAEQAENFGPIVLLPPMA